MRRPLRITAALTLAVLAVIGAVLFFQSQDEASISQGQELGAPYRGDPVLSPGLEDAIALGNVVILHREGRPPRGTRELQAGAGPDLRQDGLAVLLEQEPTLDAPLAAVSRTRILRADRPASLRPFVDRYLGRR